ncbi:MAG: D-2-hydroxyacid dehydrogenase [Gammaproteobacteria bacterium]|nr:D-2-hydroxyacid dehydrogenase [Gammaproteobacteria bacterium]MDH3371126.1 D-2-hydroxyacid dehydrogenase [Gammaproteobacteria bacterium]MDH3405900.1 D-2-hydroxyacid dehydrogenase [Gammaproteobacteria bacterium]MDH3562586.1 D-2-hydroxyacid dehydrogenase [Gammaproteobacteria bacterium]MDH5486403.1 D-2-hydroxyacid dehydrogenase [Gammaproteobacteria bacterium]
MERIVFLDRDSVKADIRRPTFPHEWQDYSATSTAEVTERLKDATIAISNKVPLKAKKLAPLHNLKMIAVCATGTDNVDLEYCRAHKITVSNIRNYAVYAVPEHVFTLILALRRNLPGYHEDVHNGLWQKAEQFCLYTRPILDLHGSALGIVGHGALGKAVAKLGEAFGMRVLVAEHKGATSVRTGRTAFDEMLAESDVITLHCPLTAETQHLIGAPELEKMRRHALLINTARGGLVDEAALAAVLKEGKIGGAGFDVLTTEPPREGNPLLDLCLSNFILTPHVAWASGNAMQIMVDQLIENIEAFVRGTPQNRVV